MSTPNLHMPEPLPPQTLAAGTLQAFGSEPEIFAPSLEASTNPTLGTGATQIGTWTQQGAWIHVQFHIQFGTVGVSAGSGDYEITLPPIPLNASLYGPRASIGVITLDDASASGAARFRMAHILAPAVLADTYVNMRVTGNAGAAIVSGSSPWTWAANDALTGQFSYLADF